MCEGNEKEKKREMEKEKEKEKEKKKENKRGAGEGDLPLSTLINDMVRKKAKKGWFIFSYYHVF